MRCACISGLGAILLFFVFFNKDVVAQTPTVQDCLGAVSVCDPIYYEPNVLWGTGNYQGEIPNCTPCDQCCPDNCISGGEENSIWYKFTVQQEGLLRLSIIPNVPSDDYDWVIYDLSFKRCEDIAMFASQMQVSCNAAGKTGTTGISSSNGGTADCQNCSSPPAGNLWNSDLLVQQGKTYVLVVNNWGAATGSSGYTLDFTASTALIFDTIRPEFAHVYGENVICGDTTVDFTFTENVLCETVFPNSFELFDPNGNAIGLTNISGIACELGAENENYFTLTVDQEFKINGEYILKIKPFTSIKDACDNTALPQEVSFNMDLGAPNVIENSMLIGAATCGASNGFITDLEINGNGPFTYFWVNSSGDTIGYDLDLIGVSSGQYTLLISDQATCETMGGPYTVPDEGAPGVDESALIVANNTCNLSNGFINGLLVSGSEPFTFEWTNESGAVVGSDLDLNSVVGNVYLLRIIDANSCEAFVGPFTIDDLPAPVIDDLGAYTTGENCNMVNGTVKEVIVSGTAPLQYHWIDELGDTISTSNPLVDVVAGTYSLLVRDANACESNSGPYVVLDLPAPQIDLSGLEVKNASCELANGSVTGLDIIGSSNLTYTWRNENNLVVGDTSVLTGLLPGEYLLTVTDEAGCESVAGPYTVINIGGIEIADLLNTNAKCELANAEIIVNTTGSPSNNQFSIDNGLTWQFENIFSGLMPATYNVIVKDENGCEDAYVGNPLLIENEGSAINVLADANNPVCTGDDLQLTVDFSGATFSWSGPQSFISGLPNPLIENVGLMNSGVYSVVVIEPSFNCSDTSAIYIDVIETFGMEVNVSASANNIYPNEQIEFYANSVHGNADVNYVWYVNGNIVQNGPDSTFATSEILGSSVVYCEMFTDADCADPNPAVSQMFTVQVADILFYLPKAFNPNSTQGNDVFKIISLVDNIPGLEFYVFDRWGAQLFESKSKGYGWDGRINGQEAPTGVYTWLVNYKVYSDEEPNGRLETKKGTVTLVR
jgi:gliding motility-associated-like protein